MEDKDKKRVEELTKLLNKYNHEYYTLNAPSVSDSQYDSLMRELIILEKKRPDLKDPLSPTMRVGGEVSSSFAKVTHKKYMLSIADVFNEEELLGFDATIRKITGLKKVTYMCELKIDGLSNAAIQEELLKEIVGNTFFFFVFLGHTYGIWRFPDLGWNQSYSC